MRRNTAKTLMIALGLGTMVLQGCPIGAFLDCFGEDTISEGAYDDLSFLEQLLYEENDCGRYEHI